MDNNVTENIAPEYGFGADHTQASGEKCPACGDILFFDPEKNCLVCRSCGTQRQIDVKAGKELDFEEIAAASTADWQEETHTYRCENCSAEEVLDKREIAVVCPFCGSPAVVEKDEIQTLKPNAVIPFTVDKEKASALAKTWAKKKWFAPNDFKTFFKPEKINGVYVPAFTFDSQSDSSYVGRLGEYYYTTHRTSNGKTVRKQHTRWFTVSGTYEEFFDDLAVSATDTIPQKYLRKIFFYDYHNCVEYSESYLYGFSALLYTKSGEACWEEARALADRKIRRGILNKYVHDVVGYLNVSTAYSSRTYKYLLVPMYTGNYQYKKKPYSFYVNGRTGKLRGASPVSPFKVSLAVILGGALAVGAFFLLKFFGVL